MRLQSKIAVITGTASGIGRASAQLFAAEGATVICVDINADANKEAYQAIASEGGRAADFTADVGDEAQVVDFAEWCAKRYDHVDILFNNAGCIEWDPIENCSLASWERVLRVNLTSAFLCSKYLLPLLKKSKAGAIVHHSSVDGLYGNPRVPAYSASKGGLIPLTHVMAHEFGKYHIRVNCIASAATVTGMSRPVPQAYNEQLMRVTPVGRFGTPKEIAATALFLASDEASYISGSVIVVDGGRTGITPGTW